MAERVVRFTEQFFERLEAFLPEERGADGVEAFWVDNRPGEVSSPAALARLWSLRGGRRSDVLIPR